MRLALWNEPAAAFFSAGLADVTAPPDVLRGSRSQCEQWLREGRVDVALLPSFSVLRQTDTFEVYPGVAFSSWKYPFARLVLREGLQRPVQSVTFGSAHAQEAFLARIILREHYKSEPTLLPRPVEDPQALLAIGADAVLLMGSEVPVLDVEGMTMDLGEEWYELVNYPMVWGLFAVRKEEAELAVFQKMRQAVRAAEERRADWLHHTPEHLHSFYLEDLRLRLDDLATAGLTQFREYLFYYGVTADVPDTPFCTLPEDEDEEPEPLC